MSESADKEVRIRVPREEARAKLQKQIDEGEAICDRPINNESDLELAKQEFEQWREYTSTLLEKLFTTKQKQLQFLSRERLTYEEFADLQRQYKGVYEEFRGKVRRHLTTLKSITGTLDLLEEDVGAGITTPSEKVFAKRVGGGSVGIKGILNVEHGAPMTTKDWTILGLVLAITPAVAFGICDAFPLPVWARIVIPLIAMIAIFAIIVWQKARFRRFTQWLDRKFTLRTKYHNM